MKRIKVLALVLIFAFGALGGAYAMWYDSLFINETVNTGIVDVQWQAVYSDDYGDNYTGYPNVYEGNKDRLDPGNPNEAKNVGSTNATLSDDNELLPEIVLACGESDPRLTDDVLNIAVFNGYPGYQQAVDARIVNVGTVPVKFDIREVSCNEVSVASAVSPDWWWPWPPWPPYDPDPDDPDPEDPPVYESGIPDWLHVQIVDTGGIVYFDSKSGEVADLPQLDPTKHKIVFVKTRVLQEAPQQANVEFQLQLKGIQWNEWGFELPDEIT